MTASRRSIITVSVLISCIAFSAGCGDRIDETTVSSEESHESRLARAAGNLQQPLVIEGQETETYGIEERMRRFSVPAVSVAVIDDGRLAAAGAWGVVAAGGDEPVTTETIFQAGSVSKPVTALLALALVGDGSLELDQPINEVLESWQVPDNDFTRAQPVTLRHVITHQAGFIPFSYLIRRGDGSVPGMAELLAGGIHDWPRVTVEFEPGSRHAYSNAGYCALQLVLEETSGASLHELAVTKMFVPLGMDHSTFDEPLGEEQLATAASGHERKQVGEGNDRRAAPVAGKAEIAPGAAGGLWTTPSDLARLAVEVMAAWRGESETLVTQQLARQFMTRQVSNEGLGIYIEGEGPALRAGHSGSMVGFVAQLVYYPNIGKGAVLMANSDGGRWVNKELLAAIASEYDWPDYPVRRTLATATPEQLRELVGVYALDASPEITFTVWLEDGAAIGQINQYPPFELAATTEPDLYVLARESLEFVFGRTTDGAVSQVTLRRTGDPGSSYTRLPTD
jgi:CubicO group peptidase (beta-lactamase class C family)